MTLLYRFFLTPLALMLAGISVEAKDAAVEGFWLTENERAVIEIVTADETMAGRIHWIIDGGMQYDTKNPDENERNTPLCGMTILWGFEPGNEAGEWRHGRIYKADSGDTYHANIELLDPDTLKLRGHIGVSFLGKTQIWKRVKEQNYKLCKIAQK